jgi:glyoxylase-like metal-dependent hydrolase (beta-lactamase superfamily II)
MRNRLLLLSLLTLSGAPAHGQMGDPTKVNLKTTPVVGAISVIEGADGFAGGNVAISIGDDGVFLVDDALPPLTAKLKAKIATLTPKPVRFVLNTHWHGDHTGGNAGLAAAGAILVAHDNVRKSMSIDQVMEFHGMTMSTPAAAPAALPILTFSDDVTLHVNGDEVHAFHVPPCHTNGDVVVHFKKANVVHTGDAFISAGYPIIDVKNGGRYDGFVAAADAILAVVNDTTRIIPGHGPLAGRAELQAWRDMLVKVRERVARAMSGGKTLEQVKAAKPTAEFDGKYGGFFVKGDDLVELLYKTPPAHPAKGSAHQAPAREQP